MTEVQFLATLLLNDKLDGESKTTIINRIIELSKPLASPFISTPFIYALPTDFCVHEYPNPWMGVTPPHCKKCGKQSYGLTITGTGLGYITNTTDSSISSTSNTVLLRGGLG